MSGLPLLLLAALSANAATPPNTLILNTATANYEIGGTPVASTGSVSTHTSANTPAIIEFLMFDPTGSSPVEQVNPTACAGGPLAAPFYPGPPSSALSIPSALSLKATEYYSAGDPVFVKVTDYDQNRNPLLIETIQITLNTSGGEAETLTLQETGPSTGVFIGYIQSTAATSAPGNCAFSVQPNVTLQATYTDPLDAVPTVVDAALVDPYGIVFDSSSAAPVNGAVVRLVVDGSGAEAAVFCDDGVTPLPQPVTTGAMTVCDAVMPAGGYRFPRVAPGTYRLIVTPPGGYAFPSTNPAPAGSYTLVGPVGSGPSWGGAFPLNPGPAIRIDVPLDSTAFGNLSITKNAGKAAAAIGEFVPYTLSIRNNSAALIGPVQIIDRLPSGFRYQQNSARLNGSPLANPVISTDGRSLTFNLGNLAGNALATLRYVALVGPGTRTGTAENTAAAAAPLTSNIARASLIVRQDLFRNQAILIGRVIIGSCDDKVDNDEQGLANARIVLQDGRYALTDRNGRWHMDNIRRGTHVVQLDLDSLPPGYEVVTCEKNTRFSARNYSQFVNVRGGTLWRADFHVQKRAPESICVDQKLNLSGNRARFDLEWPAATASSSLTFLLPENSKSANLTLNGKRIESDSSDGMLIVRLPARAAKARDQIEFDLDGTAAKRSLKALLRVQTTGLPAQSLPALAMEANASGAGESRQCAPMKINDAPTPETPHAAPAQRQAQLVEKLPYDKEWLASAQPGTEWLHPQESFYPALPAVKIAVKHLPTQRVEFLLNGEKVSSLNYDGMFVNGPRTVALSTWRGVDLQDGANRLEMRVLDETGKRVKQETRTIRYVSTPTRAVFHEAQSRLLADGRTRPVIAVKFTDQDGHPVRTGVNGEFDLNEPYVAYDKLEGIERAPLAGRTGGRPRYEITADGIALIELRPTTQAGEVVLGFQFHQQQKQEIRTWLKPADRDWILAGFAEGTLTHKKLSGNMQALKGSEADEKLFDGNRIAFYAKGKIKGGFLLTIAYDTAKRSGDSASPYRNLKQAIDPNQFYTLFADASSPQYDAASARKLYLKIEKAQFYSLFGDFDTGLTVTEFSRYSRTLNGIKSEYKGTQFSYNAFATNTRQAYVRDEIQGDGTAGLYKLSRNGIVINSDKVRIETRDRFHSEVILTSRQLARYLDYDIDPVKGTLFFTEPVPSKDSHFNPVYIVAEYESQSSADEKATYGGRVAFKPAENLEIGATHIHEGTTGASGNLTGADVTFKLSPATTIKAEFAASDRKTGGAKSDGTAWKVEALHETATSSARVYAREQDGDFGLGQQSISETGTRKIGADGRLKLSDTLQLQGELYRQDTLGNNAQRDVASVQALWQKDALTAHAGLRLAHDEDGAGKTLDSRQIIGGIAYDMLDKKLTLKAAAEIDVSGNNGESVDFPNRFKIGADYKLTTQTSLFAEQEFARGNKLSADTTRVGLRTRPWQGSEMAAALGNDFNQDSDRLFASLGLTHKWQINEHWQADFGIDRTQTLGKTGVTPLNPSVPLASGSLAGDFTALFAGAHYNDKTWSANGRIEWRTADTDDKVNVLLGMQRNLDEGRSLAAGLTLTRSEAVGLLSRRVDGRISYAHRPWDSEWVWLNRLDVIDEITENTDGRSHARKLVNNFNANWMPNRRTQVALQYGAKYVLDTIDGKDYRGYTDLLGMEIRRDINKDWDIGLHAGLLHGWGAGQLDYSLGASVGYKVYDNAWLAVGYNWMGFEDSDFSGAEYRAKGFYASIRMKVDQDTLGLNAPGGPRLLKR